VQIRCYSGLTINATDLRAHLPGAEMAAPLARGDLLKAIKDECNVVIIIDGKFHHSLSVSPSEIMDGLRAGIRIYGSSSMGAMRACELEPYGMMGYGEIFNLIKAQRAFRDDLLGQVFMPDAPDRAHLAFIDVYFNCETLRKQGKLRADDVRRVTKLYSSLHYSERSPYMLRDLCKNAFESRPRVLRLIERAATRMGSQKKRDALGLLSKVKRDLVQIERVNKRLQGALNP
jgi:TfuA protein